MLCYVMLCQVRLGQIRLGQVRLGQVRLGQVRLGQVNLSQVRLGQVRLGLGYFRLGLGWFGLVWIGSVRLGQVRSGQVRLGQVRLGPSLILAGNVGTNPCGLHSKGSILALCANIRHIVSFYDKKLITTVKRFVITDPGSPFSELGNISCSTMISTHFVIRYWTRLKRLVGNDTLQPIQSRASATKKKV